MVKVTFSVGADECDTPLSVVGDFNDWDPTSSPLRKRSNGSRSAAVELRRGASYRFKYLADGGVWFCDSTTETVGAGDGADSVLVL